MARTTSEADTGISGVKHNNSTDNQGRITGLALHYGVK